MNDPKISDLTSRVWNYDLVLDHRSKWTEHCKNERDRFKALLHRIMNSPSGKPDNSIIATEEKVLAQLESLATGVKDAEDRFRGSKPFFIGPATIDSLVNTVPESYECLIDKKLPFDDLFFEFPERTDMTLPFKNEPISVLGIQLFRYLPQSFDRKDIDVSQNSQTYYCLTAYCANEKGAIEGIVVEYDPCKQGVFVLHLNHQICKVDFNNRRFSINTQAPVDLDENARKVILPFENRPFEEAGDLDKFTKIPNICINLINYINSHNTTVIKRTREYNLTRTSSRGNKTRVHVRQPFYIVTVNDRTVQERLEDPEKSWELEWRIYVRGHDRRYRDESGRIVRTTWIHPHIKGPPDAPWREQRYQVLYEKLRREQELFKSLGLS